MKGNRQGFLSRSITRRSDQNSKIKYCFFILLFCRQLVGKVRTGFFDKLSGGTKSLRDCIYSLASCSKRSSATGFTAGAQALNSSTTRSR